MLLKLSVRDAGSYNHEELSCMRVTNGHAAKKVSTWVTHDKVAQQPWNW